MKLFDVATRIGIGLGMTGVAVLSSAKMANETGILAKFVAWSLNCENVDTTNDFRDPLTKAATYYAAVLLATVLAMSTIRPNLLLTFLLGSTATLGIAINTFSEIGIGTCVMNRARPYMG